MDRFDLVYAFGVLHHTPDTRMAIAEIHRVLKPGGNTIVALYHRNSWFFWFKKIIWDGLLRGWLFRKWWRRLMAEIEFHSEINDAIPIVKVYSRRQVFRLFSMFQSRKIVVCHVDASHFRLLRPLIKYVGGRILERWLGWGGWYVVIHAQK